ncbi:MAG: peptide chain release factor N(5)-glutamine methyltransferase [Candidatus Doudnabacteria bacterium]|nr:peptide chain release factor N(5)-glutamine methyltransferase [Candidatus Doudnabacteria bacterium]
MTIHDLLKLAAKKLTNSTSRELDGEVLLSYVLKKPKEYLFANPYKKIAPKLEKTYLRLINRRLLGWPVAYLVKHKEFFGLDFYVDKNVLIPRPETEGLVELALDTLKIENRKWKILDVGTGSGCIIISLAKNLSSLHPAPSILSFASDISPQAIKIAKKNAKKYKVKVTFGDGNLLEPWGGEKFDVIVANLPYLSRETDASTKYEPKGALIAAKKGLKLYEELFKQASRLQPQTSHLFLEIGRDQGRLIKNLAKKYLPDYRTKTYKDLFGRTRYAKVVKPS